MNNEPILEKDFCDKTGISIEEMREIRSQKMTENVHYEKRGKKIFILSAGQKMIADAIEKLPPEDFENSGEAPLMALPKEETPPSADTPVAGYIGTAIVTKLSKNRNLVICDVDGIPEQYVRVKNNKKFMRGMSMRVRKGREKNIWFYENNCPRFIGRW